MKFDVLTLFPEMFENVINSSIMGRAVETEIIEVNVINFRDYTTDKHGKVDGYPFGGGPGMVIKPEPIFNVIESIGLPQDNNERTVYLTAQGKPYEQQKAYELSKLNRIILICGHYEEIDERVRSQLVDEEISIGDYVLTGGEIPAMVLMDSITRLLPGVLGHEDSAREDSFMEGLIEHPHYTRPAEFRGLKVPGVLLSGDHGAIRRWRRKESIRRTLQVRPDLLKKLKLSHEDNKLLLEVKEEEGFKIE